MELKAAGDIYAPYIVVELMSAFQNEQISPLSDGPDIGKAAPFEVDSKILLY
jgi:hypothetical protein